MAGADVLSYNLLQEFDLDGSDVISADLQIVTFFSAVDDQAIGDTLDITLDLDNTLDFDFTAINSGIVDGDTVQISRLLPKMKAADYLKDIITLYNMYSGDPDPEGNVLFEDIDNFYFPTDDVDQWSDKVDRDMPIEIAPAANIKGKVYEFHWAQDRDYYKQLYYDLHGIDYGDNDYNLPSTFKKGVKKYHLKSAQSCPVAINGSNFIIPRIVKVDEGTMLSSPHKGKPRMFLYNGVKPSVDWNLVNSDTGAITVISTGYPQVHHLDSLTAATFDLNFGIPIDVFYIATTYTDNNCFTKHHAQFIRELTGRDSKLVNLFARLRGTDLYDDFLRRLCNVDGVLYRKNIVKDYLANDNKVTKVELVKILAGNSRKKFTYTELPQTFEPDFSGFGNESDDFNVAQNKSVYFVDTTVKSITPTLDGRIFKSGYRFSIKKLVAPGKVTIVTAGGELIDGSPTLVLNAKGDSADLYWDGTNFLII